MTVDEGAAAIYEILTGEDPPIPGREKMKKVKTFLCRKCGETDEAKFYPSDPGRCKACRMKIESESKPKLWTPIEPGGDTPAMSPETPPETSTTAPDCICKSCGNSFETYEHGALWITGTCQRCISSKMLQTKAHNNAKKHHTITIDFSTEPAWMFETLKEWATRDRRTPSDQIMMLLEDKLREVGGVS